MRKRILALLILLVMIAFSLCSCTMEMYRHWRFLCDTYPQLSRAVTIIGHTEIGYCAEYKGKTYVYDDRALFDLPLIAIYSPEDLILIGWNALPLGLFAIEQYFSDTTDDPIYIYDSRGNAIYLRSDYDPLSEIYVIDGTEHKFVFSDMFTEATIERPSRPCDASVVLYSEKHPFLQISLSLYRIESTWYAIVGWDNYKVNDAFLNLITLNKEETN